jgi:hypothetical protein
MNEGDVIDAFIAYLREHGHPSLQIDRRPDKENRNSGDIDAVAGGFSIEHTSIDTLPNQRRDSDWFIQVAGGLEQELTSKPPFRLNVTLEYEAVAKGQDWATIRHALKKWITGKAEHLADGRHVLNNIPGIPFRLCVRKSSNRRPGIFFGRFEPDDETLPARIKEQFDKKANKLTKYHIPGKTTVLLIENDDIALMNEGKMLDAIQKAYPNGPPQVVDQIWYVDTSIPSEIEFRDFTHDLMKRDRSTTQSSGCGRPCPLSQPLTSREG